MATIVTRETGATAVNRALTNAELDNNFINLNTDIGNKQPLDADLTAIAALTGSGGLLKRAGDSSWLLDYSTYATQTYVGIQIANLVSSAPTTLDTLNELATALGNDANFSTTITTALGNKQPLDGDLTAIAALSGTSGFLKKTAADTWALDTNSYALSSHTHAYLSAESDTLATVTARGASTSTAVTFSSTANHYSGHFYWDAYEAGGNHYPHFNDGGSASGVKVNWRLYTGGTNSVTHQWTISNTDFANNVRTPIFYDLNDTGYYLDPNSTGTSLKVAGNVDLYARSASWAEGIRIRVPNTNNWGGIRWTRDRGNDDGNWALGYTALDSTDDLILWANNSGDSSIKFRVTKAGTMTLNGAFNATSKSFLIDHPTKPGMKLRYGSLEGPENGVYIRGKQRGNRIELPDYWTKLVDPDSITVTLTPVGKHQKLYVDKIENNAVYVGNDGLFSGEAHYFYVVYAERVDVEKLGVEIPA
jgi:hypothetical protein